MFAFLEESDQAAAIIVHVENSEPLTAPVETWHIANQIRNVQVAQNARLMRFFGHILYKAVAFSSLFLVFKFGVCKVIEIFLLGLILLRHVEGLNFRLNEDTHLALSEVVAQFFVDNGVIVRHKTDALI